MVYRSYSFYARIEKPIDCMLDLYFHFIIDLKEVRGRRIFYNIKREYNGNVYLYIPNVVRVFCFYDWFKTRVDLEINIGLCSDNFYDELNRTIKYLLTPIQSVDVDFNLLFLDVTSLEEKKRIDIEGADRWEG